MSEKDTSSHFLVGFIVGTVVGVAIGFLYAPKSGKETRALLKEKAGEELQKIMDTICSELQEVLKVEGDWKIFPSAVRLIAEGRVKVEGREIFLDDKKLPEYGYRLG